MFRFLLVVIAAFALARSLLVLTLHLRLRLSVAAASRVVFVIRQAVVLDYLAAAGVQVATAARSRLVAELGTHELAVPAAPGLIRLPDR